MLGLLDTFLPVGAAAKGVRSTPTQGSTPVPPQGMTPDPANVRPAPERENVPGPQDPWAPPPLLSEPEVDPKTQSMRAPPGGGLRGPMGATPSRVTAYPESDPAVEVLPRSTVPMSDFEEAEPGHYLRRKAPDSSTQAGILANAGHVTDGRLRDANTGRALNPGEAVWGHAPDFQFAVMRNLFEAQGKTQEEFDEFYRDPKKWQVEYGPTNSSRVFDRIPRQLPIH